MVQEYGPKAFLNIFYNNHVLMGFIDVERWVVQEINFVNWLHGRIWDAQMQCNVGKTNRMIRIIGGVAVIAAGFFYQSWWGAVGIVPLHTSALRWCPPYQLLNISTVKK